jgi:glycosyltransferase involved in cell wall biosynthesis
VSIRVVCVVPEPTPYRSPLFDRLAARADLDLLVVYAAQSVQDRRWEVSLAHPHVVLGGLRLPGATRVLRHDYPVDARIRSALEVRRPEVVVIAGWSTFASQYALWWCNRNDVPFIVTMESHGREPRSAWKDALRRAVVSRILSRASSVLATGSLARAHAAGLGVDPRKIRIVPNTVDVSALGDAVERERRTRQADDATRVVLSVARLVPEKGLDTLVASTESLPDVRVVIAGEGELRAQLERTAGTRVTLAGQLAGAELIGAYAAADIFALLSRREPWGVVVVEAAAAGLPLVVSDRVGAAADLVEHGSNGFVIPADDVSAACDAIARLARDGDLRRQFGARSRELAGRWGYERAIAAFVEAVEEAAAAQS